MTFVLKYVSSALLISFLFASHVTAAESLASVLARMDEGAHKFKSMTAHVKTVSHTAVIDDTTTEDGAITMQRNSKGETNALIEFTGERDPRTVAFHDKTIEIYFPKAKLVQIYDLGKRIKLLDQYLLLGFGTSGKDITSNYEVSFAGTETITGQPSSKLQLVPKSKEVSQNLSKAEIWIPVDANHPVQQKLYRPSGDYNLFTYTNYQQNPPLNSDALKLRVPAGVKKERP